MLLAGGTDGGNAEALLAGARVLAGRRLARRRSWSPATSTPRTTVAALLDGSGTPYVLADNVVPRIGVLAPGLGPRPRSARCSCAHVIGGKHLSTPRPTSPRWCAAPPPTWCSPASSCSPTAWTPSTRAGDVVVVDVGGATTDVHSVVELDPEDAGLAREVVATTPVTRTVEGDLGMRWSAVTTVEAGGRGRAARRTTERLRPPRRTRATTRRSCPATDAERDEDEAHRRARPSGLALRRHAGRRKVVRQPGGPGRRAQRQGPARGRPAGRLGRRAAPRPTADVAARVLGRSPGTRRGRLAAAATRRGSVVDHDYVLAAAGLLAGRHPRAAHALLARLR